MRKILVVDDDKIIIYSVMYYLKRNGFDAVSSDDPFNVDATIAEHKPDAMIMDIFMNGEDGREICRRLKNSALKTLPIILYSVDKFEREDILTYGANEFLQKPLEEDKLVEALDYVLKLGNSTAVKIPEKNYQKSLAASFIFRNISYAGMQPAILRDLQTKAIKAFSPVIVFKN